MVERTTKGGFQGAKYAYSDVSKIIPGITRVSLEEQKSFGYVVPDVKAHGPGTRNLYTRENLVEIRFFRYLTSSGLSRAEASRRVKAFRKAWNSYGSDDLSRPEVVRFIILKDTLSAEVFSRDEKWERMSPLRDSAVYRVEDINIGRIIDEIDMVINKD